MNNNHSHLSSAQPAAHRLDRLLTVWNSHQDLRSGGASPAQLWQSRTELDEVRLEVRLAA